MMSSTASASRMSSSWSSASPAPERFSRRPVERSSTTVTSSPRASRASTRLEPMKPAPPVTKVLIRSPILEGSAAPACWTGRAPLLPSPPHAAHSHREEQQRREDRRLPQQGERDERQNLQSPLLHLDRRERRRPPHDRPQGPRARSGLPRG